MKESSRSLSEEAFTRQRVVPVLRKLGFRHVRLTHGTDEFGRDVVFRCNCKFGLEHLYGAQIKGRDVSGSAESRIGKLVQQVDLALTQPYTDVATRKDWLLAGLYVIISGRFTRNAKEVLKNRIRKGNVWLVDGETLSHLEAQSGPIQRNESELQRLVRQARASMRVDTTDVRPLQIALEEINLLPGLELPEKSDAISELAQEIVLNSDPGSAVLSGAILFLMSTEMISMSVLDEPAPARSRGLSMLAGVLWNVLRDALEYHRSNKTCRMIVDAIVSAWEAACEHHEAAVAGVCAEALRACLPHASSRTRGEVRAHIRRALRKLAQAVR